MEKKMYCLMKNPNNENEELHIFEMKFHHFEGNEPIYYFYPKSDKDEKYKCICKKFQYDILEETKESNEVYDEIGMRELCAKRGRQVCGICIASLYGNFRD